MSRKLILKIIDWCENRYGLSKFQSTFFKLRVYKHKKIQADEGTQFGSYCENKNLLTIYLVSITSVELLIQIVIHEYTHYLQPIKTYYKDLWDHYGGYKKHPLEIEAWEVAYRDYRICLEALEKSLGIKLRQKQI